VAGGVIIGSQTVHLSSGPSTSPEDGQNLEFVANSQTFTAVPGSSKGEVIIDGVTVTAFHSAVTVHGATISAGSDGFVVDESTLSQADTTGSNLPAVITIGSDVATASTMSSGVFAIGTVTLTAGEAGTTISGHSVSAVSSGIVVDGGSTSASATGTQQTQGSQGTGNSPPGTQSSVASASSSDAAKLDTLRWAVLVICSFALML
jgi:hypothetical protein